MNIAYLANYPQQVATVAKWVMDKLGHESPGMTQESFEERFQTHLNRNAIPLTLHAIEVDCPQGTASLVFLTYKTTRSYRPGWRRFTFCQNIAEKESARN